MGRLRSRTVPVAEVDPALLGRMWAVFDAHYEGVDRAQFEADLRRKDAVIVVEDGARVAGFSTLVALTGTAGGRPYAALFSGDTVVDTAYWGQGALQRRFIVELARFWWRSRHVDAYWFLISKGYKTYLLLTRNWIEAWPVRGARMPPVVSAVRDDLATRLFGAAYDPSSGVVRFDPPVGRVKTGVAPTEAAGGDPDVAFFVTVNPGHARGDELCCLGKLSPALFLRLAARWTLPGARRRAGRGGVGSGSG